MNANVPAWEDDRWTALPHLQGTERTDVCVVGLGGSGLSAVETLLQNDVAVIGIDAGHIAGGAAGANGGFLLAGAARFYHQVVATFGRGRARQLYLLTVDEIERMAMDMPDLVRLTGSLRIGAGPDEMLDCNEQLRAMQEDGLPVMAYQGVEGEGLLIPTDGVFNPLLRCRRLAERCMQRGARLFEHSRAIEIGAGFVRTDQGLVRCQNIIVAVDGKLDSVFPQLAPRVRTARLQMLSTVPTQIKFQRPVYMRWGYDYWQQLPDGRVVLGGCRDAALEEEWTYDTKPSQAIQERLTALLRHRLGVNAAVERRWAAGVGYTHDGLPIVEEVRNGVWALGGYSGTGNVVGVLCGRAIAERVAGRGSSLWAAIAER